MILKRTNSSAFTKTLQLKNTTNGNLGVYSIHAIYKQYSWFTERLVVSPDIDIVLFKCEHGELLIKVHLVGLSCVRENHADIWECILEKEIISLPDNILTFKIFWN